MCGAHVKNERGRPVSKGFPVDFVRYVTTRVMTGDKGDGRIGAARCHRDTCIGKAAHAGGNAGYDPERDMRLDESEALLGAPAKHKGITALQAQYALPLPSQFDQSLRNISLLWRWFSAAFTGKFLQCLWPSKFQNVVPYQGVIDNHIGGLQGV